MARPIDSNRPEFELEILRRAARVFSERGYRESTTEDIAKQVKLKKSSLYHYFKSKENILFQAISLNLKNSLEPLIAIEREDISAQDKLDKAIACQVEAMLDAPYLALLFITDKCSLSMKHLRICLELRDRHERIFRDIIEQGVRQGVFRKTDASIAVKFIFGALNWLPVWWKPSGRYGRQEIIAQIRDTLANRMLCK